VRIPLRNRSLYLRVCRKNVRIYYGVARGEHAGTDDE
jgi:hypothetical protein